MVAESRARDRLDGLAKPADVRADEDVATALLEDGCVSGDARVVGPDVDMRHRYPDRKFSTTTVGA